MNLESIVQYMREKKLGAPGVNLFAYGMPESVLQGLLVTSQMPIERNKYVTQLRRGEFQVIARGSLHAELIDRLNSVSDALNVQGVIIGDMNFRFIVPLNNPLVFPRADSRLLEASVNFEFAFTQPA